MTTVSLTTVGCKVNQVDTDDLRRELLAAGVVEVRFGEPADVAIINSCTVTARADSDSRSLVRRARRANPDCLVVLTGCLPSRPDAGPVDDVDLRIGNAQKPTLVRSILDRHRRASLQTHP